MTEDEIRQWLQDIIREEIRKQNAFGTEKPTRAYEVAKEVLEFFQQQDNDKNESGNNIVQGYFDNKTPQELA